MVAAPNETSPSEAHFLGVARGLGGLLVLAGDRPQVGCQNQSSHSRDPARPVQRIGKPEPLKHAFQGYWSRRINDEHRIVYKIQDDAVLIAQLRYHHQSGPVAQREPSAKQAHPGPGTSRRSRSCPARRAPAGERLAHLWGVRRLVPVMRTAIAFDVARDSPRRWLSGLGMGFAEVALFGSRSRGEARWRSDYDLMVVLRSASGEARDAIHRLATTLELEHNVDLSTKIVDRELFPAAPAILPAVLAQLRARRRGRYGHRRDRRAPERQPSPGRGTSWQ